MAVVVVVVIEPVEAGLLPVVQRTVDKVVLYADAGVEEVGMVAVGHEEYVADQAVQSVAYLDAGFVRLACKVGFYLALGVKLRLHRIDFPRVGGLQEGLLYVVGMGTKQLSEEVLMDVGLGVERFVEVQAIAFNLFTRHGE